MDCPVQAVISIAVILVVVLAAALAFVLLRRGSGHGRGFLTRVSSLCPAGCFAVVHSTRNLRPGIRQHAAFG